VANAAPAWQDSGVNRSTARSAAVGESHEPAVVASMSGVRFKWRARDAFTLEVPSFHVAAGERVLMVGPSGSGKSTFLSLLSGIAVPQVGAIRVMGTDLTALAGSERDRFRADHLGIIFQMFNLVPYLSCIDNVLLPLGFSPARRRRVGDRNAAAREGRRLMSRLGLDPAVFADKPAAEMSVGQQQRIAAARALIGRPDLVIADEPTSALDRDLQKAFVALLGDEVAAGGSALLMVSHDSSLTPLFDRIVPLAETIVDGRVTSAPAEPAPA
jgi:putative ABC transport system ATP-binding protein